MIKNKKPVGWRRKTLKMFDQSNKSVEFVISERQKLLSKKTEEKIFQAIVRKINKKRADHF